jgi:diaminopimelate epimerase
MLERLHKYHGLGNDFVLLDRRTGGMDIDAAQARLLCNRHRGVGADGVLVLLPSTRAELRLSIHNADGSVPEMCGNGLRCVAKHVLESSGRRAEALSVETLAGVLTARASWDGASVKEVEVEMGPARLVAANLPSGATGSPFASAPVPGTPFHGTAVSMGNPHLVLLDAPLDQAATWGAHLEAAPGFPERTNVEFLTREGEALRVVVWERGVGLTQACGTGACAALVAAVLAGWAAPASWVEVRLPGGALGLRVSADFGQVTLRGPARFVFTADMSAWPTEEPPARVS